LGQLDWLPSKYQADRFRKRMVKKFSVLRAGYQWDGV
jgi:hypothetical protein